MPSDRLRKRTGGFLRQLAMAMELPFIPIIAVLIGGGLGYLLDARLHTTPLFAIALGLIGFLGGVREILRRLSDAERSGKGNDGEQ